MEGGTGTGATAKGTRASSKDKAGSDHPSTSKSTHSPSTTTNGNGTTGNGGNGGSFSSSSSCSFVTDQWRRFLSVRGSDNTIKEAMTRFQATLVMPDLSTTPSLKLSSLSGKKGVVVTIHGNDAKQVSNMS